MTTKRQRKKTPAPPPNPGRFASLSERRTFGRSCRNVIKRVDQAEWKPSPQRPDPVAALLAANAGRVAELLPIKWGRMAMSPFSFFRGAAPLMAADLAATPVSGLRVQLCGDAHVVNLGAYAAPDGHLVFDLNDFDETIAGPWEWDVKRLATSLILAGREAGDKKTNRIRAVRAFVASYRESLARFAEMKVMELTKWEVRRHTRSGPVRAILQRAERATPDITLRKLTVPAGRGGHRFRDRPPLLYRVPQKTADAVLASLDAYRDRLTPDRQQVLDAFQPMDVGFKVVGTGSVGTRNYVVLFVSSRTDDPLFLQVKEELPSCYAPYLRDVPPYPHQGRRVADGQHRLQTVTDSLLGWTTLDGGDYLVRHLADHKAAADLSQLKAAALVEYGVVCGEVLAKAHSRTGDAAALSGYCGNSPKLDRAITAFAAAYANQTESDHAALVRAIKAGKVKMFPS
jgi:uncharacterized protein (DUF2252 family)